MWHSQKGLWVGEPSAILSARLRPLRMLATRSSSVLVPSQLCSRFFFSGRRCKGSGCTYVAEPGERPARDKERGEVLRWGWQLPAGAPRLLMREPGVAEEHRTIL